MKEYVYICGLSSLVIGLIFLINIIFKNMWGRARPNEIIDFGGINFYTMVSNIRSMCIVIALLFLVMLRLVFHCFLFFN